MQACVKSGLCNAGQCVIAMRAFDMPKNIQTTAPCHTDWGQAREPAARGNLPSTGRADEAQTRSDVCISKYGVQRNRPCHAPPRTKKTNCWVLFFLKTSELNRCCFGSFFLLLKITVSCSSCWGYSLINTLKLKKNTTVYIFWWDSARGGAAWCSAFRRIISSIFVWVKCYYYGTHDVQIHVSIV